MADIPSIGTKGRTILAVPGSAIASLTAGSITTGQPANNGRAVEHLSNTLGMSRPMLRTDGMRGRLSHHYGRTRLGVKNVGGRITLAPGPEELNWIWPLIGGDGSIASGTNSGGLTDAGGIEFDAFVDRDQQRHIYTGCKVVRAEFRSAIGGMLILNLDVIGKDESCVATALPSLAISSQGPLMHHDSSTRVILNEGGSSQKTIKPAEIMWAINHIPRDDNYANSETRVNIPITDRIVDVMFRLPWTDDLIAIPSHPAPYLGFGSGTADLIGRVDLGYTNADIGTIGFSLALPKVKFNQQTPADDGRTELFQELSGQAFTLSDSTREIIDLVITTS